jgi:hypothetical protein
MKNRTNFTFEFVLVFKTGFSTASLRVSVQGVKSLGDHFACLFFVIIFQKEKGNTFTLLVIFIVKSLQK